MQVEVLRLEQLGPVVLEAAVLMFALTVVIVTAGLSVV